MIIGITTTFLHCQNLPISLLHSWYRSTFSCSFSFTLVSNEYATSIMLHSPVCLSTIKMRGLLCSSLRSVCTEKSHCLYHFLALSLDLKIRIFKTLPKEHLHQLSHVSVGGTVFEEAFYILTFCNHMTDCFLSFSPQSSKG